MKTTFYEPGNATRYEIGSHEDKETGETCFVWWALQAAKSGVALNMVQGGYCTPSRVWAALPHGLVSPELDYPTSQERWFEDCRVVAYYINSAMLPEPERHNEYKADHLPTHAHLQGGVS